ncbi:helix-turn-helix domain-containing protein [Enterococcus cecorum]|uniref:Transposase putative helix-turn-helix domain-containing protein n=1 Tax=Enterococcus cecorum TaxID=44008 RepID=A0A366SK75_9ENTE|nr:helix-turn-helix domain-containing protein [Enterococcus cecorum]RBR31681.1 hypothetical protein EB18_00104 [Enterococcus cecorum]
MRTAIKIRLKPTKEQEILFKKSCGVADGLTIIFWLKTRNIMQNIKKRSKKQKLESILIMC